MGRSRATAAAKTRTSALTAAHATTAATGDGGRAARRRRRGRSAEFWGRAAEDQVALRYEAMGGVVLARRARTPGGEIDLVVALGDAIVFVEVRARARLALAAETVTPEKLARLSLAAECWLADAPGSDARVDVAAVVRAGAVRLYENVTLH